MKIFTGVILEDGLMFTMLLRRVHLVFAGQFLEVSRFPAQLKPENGMIFEYAVKAITFRYGSMKVKFLISPIIQHI